MTDAEILQLAEQTATVYHNRTDLSYPSYGFVNETLLKFAHTLLERAQHESQGQTHVGDDKVRP